MPITKLNKLILILTCSFVPFLLSAEKYPCPQHCTFVMVSDAIEKPVIINELRANKAFTPYSSFKVANSVIALDVGVVKSIDQLLSYDKAQYPVESWWPKSWYSEPINLAQAFKYSAVPIYQQLATEIGQQSMQQYLNQFNYGNKDISSGLDNFWLNGSIKISAQEQTIFLKQLFTKQLPLKSASIDLLKTIMNAEQTDSYTLYAKTGAGPMEKGHYIGWYVGMVETKGEQYFFAANVSGETFKGVINKRIEFAREQLKLHKVI